MILVPPSVPIILMKQHPETSQESTLFSPLSYMDLVYIFSYLKLLPPNLAMWFVHLNKHLNRTELLKLLIAFERHKNNKQLIYRLNKSV